MNRSCHHFLFTKLQKFTSLWGSNESSMDGSETINAMISECGFRCCAPNGNQTRAGNGEPMKTSFQLNAPKIVHEWKKSGSSRHCGYLRSVVAHSMSFRHHRLQTVLSFCVGDFCASSSPPVQSYWRGGHPPPVHALYCSLYWVVLFDHLISDWLHLNNKHA